MKVRRVDFSPDEWIGGTVELDNAERGLYITACALIYSAGGPISHEMLRAACRDHGRAFTRQLDRLTALGKLTYSKGQISNKRCENELQNALKRAEKARENGGKSPGRPKKNNDLENQPGIDGEKLTINHQPSTTKEEIPNGILSEDGLRRPADIAATMTSIWNEICGFISRANKPNPSRVQRCAARWRQDFGGSADDWAAFCRRVAASPHLRGENDRGWRVDFDWVLKPENISRIVEGRYDQRIPTAVETAVQRDRPSGPPPPILAVVGG